MRSTSKEGDLSGLAVVSRGFVELSGDPWSSDRILLFPAISRHMNDLLEGSSLPETLVCRRCLDDHPRVMINGLSWPYQRFNAYFGPIPGYKREGCARVYVPRNIHRGLQRAVRLEMEGRSS